MSRPRQKQMPKDLWLQTVRDSWFINWEQLVLPGMPEPPEGAQPPKQTVFRALPAWLISYANPDGTNIKPAVETLATILSCSDRSIQKALRMYEKRMLLVKMNAGNGGKKVTTEYRTGFPAWLFGDQSKGELTDGVSKPKGRTERHQRVNSQRGDQSLSSTKTKTKANDAPEGARVVAAEDRDPKPLDPAIWRLPDECAHGNISGECDPCEALTAEKTQAEAELLHNEYDDEPTNQPAEPSEVSAQ